MSIKSDRKLEIDETLKPIDNFNDDNLEKSVKATLFKLLDYCKKNEWAGYDPYDALNSRIFKAIPFLDFRIARLAITQAMKRLPFNLRKFLLIPKTQNPKGLALFLGAFLKIQNHGLLDMESCIQKMTEKLVTLRSQDSPYWCWGYSFPWQTREILVARGAPNIVCTYFVADALLDVYESNGESNYLNMAVSAARYILNELYWTKGDSVACFSYFKYPPQVLCHKVHNVNFLGAALLCRIYRHCGQKKFLAPALKVARYSAGKQNIDGSWDYGEHPKHRWIDNFHTGYNLCALQSICQHAKTSEFEKHIHLGFDFYRKSFFRNDGVPKYFNNSTYPIDIHNVAQSILTLLAFKHFDESNVNMANAIFKWAMSNMWDEEGCFYYQAFPFFTSKISYMRWSQAWMLTALVALLEEVEKDQKKKEMRELLFEKDLSWCNKDENRITG